MRLNEDSFKEERDWETLLELEPPTDDELRLANRFVIRDSSVSGIHKYLFRLFKADMISGKAYCRIEEMFAEGKLAFGGYRRVDGDMTQVACAS